jgi:hypothetical protein
MIAMLPITMFLLAQAATTGPQRPPAHPIVQVGIFSYRPDGTVGGAAYETDLTNGTIVYVAGCTIGAGNRPAPDRASDAWRVSGKVQSADATEAVVQLDWQRIRANGSAVTAPGGSVQLTLHPGDRVPLDSASPDAPAQCMAPTIVFEARYDTVFGLSARGGGASGSRVGAGGGFASGADRGVGGGGGSATSRGAGGATRSGARTAEGGGAGVERPKAVESRELDVDLWLVRSAPGRKEETLHQALHGVRGGAQFAFAPVSVDTPRGPASVQVSGSFHTQLDESGAQQLVVVTLRNARLAGAGAPPRDIPQSVQGGSITTHPMPGPDDVLSLEMPPLRLPNGAAAVPDQFSVRIRIR